MDAYTIAPLKVSANLVLYSLFLLLCSLCLIHYPYFSLIFTILAFLAFIFLSTFNFKKETTFALKLFTYAKRYSVVIPIILYALTSFMHYTKGFHSHYFSFLLSQNWLTFFVIILALNILEAGLLSFFSQGAQNKVNGIILIGFTLVVPINWVINNSIIGFSNVYWILGSSLSLIHLYFFNEAFHREKVSYLDIMALVIPLLGVFLQKINWLYWMPFRAYTLYLLILQFSIFPTTKKYFYYEKTIEGFLVDRILPWLSIAISSILLLITTYHRLF